MCVCVCDGLGGAVPMASDRSPDAATMLQRTCVQDGTAEVPEPRLSEAGAS